MSRKLFKMAGNSLDFEFAVTPIALFDKYKGLELAVWAALWSFSSFDQRQCFPSIAKLSERAGVSEKTVRRALKKFSDDGYVSVVHRKGDNDSYTSNLYTINVHRFVEPKKPIEVLPHRQEGTVSQTVPTVSQTN